ncbi:CHASE2 domain-containing protein [Undibacterium amnicola]|uniref:histidine kinase n=1 Tax=Undibacterium amnicola TaxID=1834038 RepID=A0ABR6XW05_9BURK|nr:CHASE2 domain-containing protein [Undibacterium amnicola]MBC3833638.1 CHASE2 domain-containing protein [Undibacterium amnicola]
MLNSKHTNAVRSANKNSGRRFKPSQSIALHEWLILSLFLFCLACVLSLFHGLQRLDQTAYDQLLRWQTQSAREDIIIVAIDDYSLAELGKWPWPRTRHAELIQKIQAAKPRAIGIDVVFTEAELPSAEKQNQQVNSIGDQALASAIAQSAKVVLPLVSVNAGQGLQAVQPTPVLNDVAAALGHIHLELDEDGVARSVFLYEGTQGQWWPHFSLALYQIGQLDQETNSAKTSQKPLPVSTLHQQITTTQAGIWHRNHQMHIPYYGSGGHFTSIPYVSVLRGEVPDAFFKDKYVLVGTTAQGMADAFPTPVTSNEGALSGIEFNANILASLLDGRSIVQAQNWQILGITCLIIATALLSFWFFSPRTALFTVLGLILTTLITSVALLRLGFWFPPAVSVLILLLAYPLWSWRRLEAAIDFLGEEFILLDQEPHLLPEFNPDLTLANGSQTPVKRLIQDKLERHFSAMQAAARRVRDLRQFVTDSLTSLPDATMVTTTDGNVVLTNPAAVDYFNSIGMPHVIDTLVPYLFANMSHPHTLYANERDSFSWWHILDLNQSDILIKGVEVVDPKNRDLIIKSAPCYSGQKVLIGWIISILDISEIRQAERRRDETLHFISHDMRAPQASILALIELQKSPKTAIEHEEFLSRIEKASNTTLGLADSFVQLAHAESNEYRYSEIDFQDMLIDATEEMWTLAKAKRIRIVTDIPEGDYPVRVDRSLMTRVLTNLLSNAIKYSPCDTTVTCTLAFETKSLNDSVVCHIQDQGYGIARADQSRLFQRFQRLGHGKPADQIKNDGIGLGMVFVKTVIDRHFAHISFTSVPGEGTCFTITIPAHNI